MWAWSITPHLQAPPASGMATTRRDLPFSTLCPTISTAPDLFYQQDKRSVINAYDIVNQICPFNLVRDISHSGGVISITTKDESDYGNDPDYTIKTIMPLGFQRPAEFYAPRYDTGDNGIGEGTDLRETLFWNPSIAFGSDKQARFNFYTGDAASTSYTITVEGVTANGELIHAVKRIGKK